MTLPARIVAVFVAAALGGYLAWQGGIRLWPFVAMAAFVLAGFAAERWRYKRVHTTVPSGSGWAQTGERFIDPSTGEAVEVHYDASTGRRAYVAGRR